MDSGTQMTLRRLRQSSLIRELVQEKILSSTQFVQPLFVVEGLKTPEPIPGLTGVSRESTYSLLTTIESDISCGVTKFIFFGIPEKKNLSEINCDFTTNQISEIRKQFGKDIFLAVDTCFCSNTVHGHCGLLDDSNEQISNIKTVAELARVSLSYAQAGADCIAPSDMMDGRIREIRSTLNSNNLENVLIMSYSAKFHSSFYGPFRLAADSSPKSDWLKDRATYQIDPSRFRDALLCSVRDSDEGADILMVKPGLSYLDVLYRLSSEIQKPWAVYQVSGEYASIELMAKNGLIDAPRAHLEVWTSFLRAGASIIISYGARFAKDWIKN